MCRDATVTHASFSYDADGNVARKYKAGVYDRNYFWNAVNQLDSTSDGATAKHFDYNAFGEPVRISTNGAISSYLVWDGDNLLAELDASGNRIADYTYVPGAIVLNRPEFSGGSVS